MLRLDHSICARCSANRLAVCAGLPLREVDEFAQTAKRLYYAKAHELDLSEIAGDSVAIVRRGAVKVCLELVDGRTQIIDFLNEGDALFMSGAPPDDGKRYHAAAELELCIFDCSEFAETCAHYPIIEQRMLEAIHNEVRRKNQHLVMLGRKRPEERIALFFLSIAERHQEGTEILPLTMSRIEVAEFLSLTTETVSRTITRLREIGAIETPDLHSIRIADPLKLQQLAAGETKRPKR